MKRIIISAVCLILSSSIFGQLDQGSILLSGTSDINFSYSTSNITFDGSKVGKIDNLKFNIKPMGGYFLIDYLVVGLYTNFGFVSAKQFDQSNISTNNFSIGPFTRYYFETGKIKPFGQLDIGYASYKELDLEDREKINTYVGFEGNIGGGAAFFIFNNLSFDALLTYRYSSFSPKEDSKFKISSSSVFFQAGISAFF